MARKSFSSKKLHKKVVELFRRDFYPAEMALILETLPRQSDIFIEAEKLSRLKQEKFLRLVEIHLWYIALGSLYRDNPYRGAGLRMVGMALRPVMRSG